MGFPSLSDIGGKAAEIGTLGLVDKGTLDTAFGRSKEDPYAINQQRALNEQLRAAAFGEGPSASDASFKHAGDQLMAQQFSLAAGTPGLAPGAAMRQAQVGAAGVGLGLAGQAAAARLQEQERNRSLYAQMLQAQRSASAQHQAMNAAALGGTLSAIGSAAGMASGGAGGGGARPGGGGGASLAQGGLMDPFGS